MDAIPSGATVSASVGHIEMQHLGPKIGSEGVRRRNNTHPSLRSAMMAPRVTEVALDFDDVDSENARAYSTRRRFLSPLA